MADAKIEVEKWELRVGKKSGHILMVGRPGGPPSTVVVFCPSEGTWHVSHNEIVQSESEWKLTLGSQDREMMDAMRTEAKFRTGG